MGNQHCRMREVRHHGMRGRMGSRGHSPGGRLWQAVVRVLPRRLDVACVGVVHEVAA